MENGDGGKWPEVKKTDQETRQVRLEENVCKRHTFERTITFDM
jgi:hypothetical protein